MKSFTLIVTGLTFASFFWGVIGLFRQGSNEGKFTYLLLRIATALTWASGLYLISTVEFRTSWQLASVAGQLFALALFWWSANSISGRPLTIVFSDNLPEHLVTWGPYRYVRNPFYAAYLLSYGSAWLWTGHWINAMNSAVLGAFYLCAILGEERKFANSRLHDEYLAYAASTGRLIPKLLSRQPLP